MYRPSSSVLRLGQYWLGEGRNSLPQWFDLSLPPVFPPPPTGGNFCYITI